MNSCSLLIPCYNAVNYLPRLWQAVQAQTIPFDEIICYDDGSTDNTVDVARELGAKVILGHTCQGPAYARNQLAKAASCDWLHFHDADDTLHPKYLERAKNQIRANIDVIVCNSDWVDAETHKLIIPWRYKQAELESDPIKYTVSHPIGVINVLYRKECFLAINGFDESMRCWEDADLHVRLAAAGARFSVLEEVLSISLRHTKGISANQLMCWDCRLQFLQKYTHDLPSTAIPTIVEQLEVAAVNLLNLGDKTTARKALQLCESLGGHPPTTNNSLLKNLKGYLPNFLVLQIQQFLRRLNLKFSRSLLYSVF